jgi:hypothetical protein
LLSTHQKTFEYNRDMTAESETADCTKNVNRVLKR